MYFVDGVSSTLTVMPSAVNAFNVKIASPGDAAMELIVAREVIGDWNSLHALQRKQVLLPLYYQQNADVTGDLLVAFFCASAVKSKSPIRESIRAEIERQLASGRPVLIYFSEARTDFADDDGEREQAELIQLKKAYGSRAVVGAYGDEKEFRAQFTRDLDAIINENAHFKTDALAAMTSPPKIAAQEPVEQKLSECAVQLLSEACEDFEAYIGRVKVGAILKIQANGKQLVEQGNAADAAKWDGAFNELLTGGYIHDAGGFNGQLFQITPKGFAFLKTIGKTPVGYIAEMGNL
jgi:hypothetical protein